MGYREMFLVMVSVILLSTLMLRINTNAVEGRDLLQRLQIEQMAASIGQQIIEEAKSKKFDELVGTSTITPSSSPSSVFTSHLSLGPDGEVYPNYNDVDDYANGLSDTLFVDGIDFELTTYVEYVQDYAPDTMVNTATFFKRMIVTVESSWLPGTITLKHVFSYFGVE
jgi:hypothetical protein